MAGCQCRADQGTVVAFLSQDHDGRARTCLATLPDGEVTCPEALVDHFPGPASPDGSTLLLIHPGADGDTLSTWRHGAEAPSHLAGPATPLREPAWSTDGNDVVFRGTLAGQIGVWRVAKTGGRPERLSDAQAGDFEPHADAHGRVVFASSRDGNAELYERTPDGTTRRLTHHVHDDIHPRLSPDGAALAWLSDVDGTRQLLVQREGQPAELVGTAGQAQQAFAWSPDSRHLAVVERSGASYQLVTRSLTGDATVVYDHDADPSPPTFSSDGETLCWTSDGRGHVVVRCAAVGGAVLPAIIADAERQSWLPRILSLSR